MDPVNVASVLVALIAALSAYASQRAASKASVVNTAVSVREEREREAYERARRYDVATIERQDLEIIEVRAENKSLKEQILQLLERVSTLEHKIRHYERNR